MITKSQKIYAAKKRSTVYRNMQFDMGLIENNPSFGPYKIVSKEKKLMEADIILACSPIVMISLILAHYIFV